MTRIEIFRRDVPVGSYVTLHRTNGGDISGRVAEVEDAFVRLYSEGATETIFEELVSGWTVHANRAPEVAADQTNSQPLVGSPKNQQTPPITPSTSSSTTDSDVTQRLTKINAELSVRVDHARLARPEPNFQFPKGEFSARAVEDARRKWDQARNKYDYALKINELSRLDNIVTQILEPLQSRYPGSATTRALLAHMLLKLKRQPDAIEHLSAAAVLSDEPSLWLALAAAVPEDTAFQCYALRRYFQLTPPVRKEESWYRYLGVAIEHHDLQNTAKLIGQWYELPAITPHTRCLLTESVIYLLTHLEANVLEMNIVDVLKHGSSVLPPDWANEFNNSQPASEALRAVEQRFHRSTAATGEVTRSDSTLERSNGARTGHIKSFGDQRFGFIATQSGDTLYFRIDDVADERLRDALLDRNWQTLGPVEFEYFPSRGHKYDRATKILPQQNRESLLQRAQDLLEFGQPPQAMALVRRVLAVDPNDEAARRLEQGVKDSIRKGLRDGIGLPKGKGPYARAKRAQLVDVDLEKAEELLKDAIQRGDNLEGAVKDLASLLDQQGRVNEAIVLLENNSNHRVSGTSPYDSLLATFYEKSDRHDHAIAVLDRLFESAPQSKKNSLLTRVAFCHLHCSRYDKAEETLQQVLSAVPHDRNALRLIAAVEDARQAESTSEIEEIIGGLGTLGDEGMELSSLARAAIERCTFQGVDPARARTDAADKEDVKRVVDLAKELGTKRPRDRAGYYLSAAALLNKSQDRQTGRIYNYLRSHFTSMADACWNDKKPADVVRSYYIESLALVDDDSLDEAWRTLVGYIATFSPRLLKELQAKLPRTQRRRRNILRIPREKYIDALQEILLMVEPESETEWREGLIAVGSESRFARDGIGKAFMASPELMSVFAALLGCSGLETNDVQRKWDERCQDHARTRRRRLSNCRASTKGPATVASMDSLGVDLRDAIAETSTEVDKRRLKTLVEIVDSAREYCRASDFEERERNYRLILTRSEEFRNEVGDAPTQYSHEGLLPIADHVSSLIEEEYARLSLTSSPELGLKLAVNQYVLGQQGELRLQVEVSNKPGCSPASSVRLRLGPEESEYFVATDRDRLVVPTLRGGHTETVHMEIRPKDTAVQERAFPVRATGIFQDHTGDKKHTAIQSWTVRLYRDDEFQQLENRYAPFAEGGPVDNPEMFVGRDDLLNRLEESLLSGSRSKSIVMFGQKRAGKSSLIEHLRRRLVRRDSVVPVAFSLQEIAPDLSESTLFYRILQGVCEALNDLRSDGIPEFIPPKIEMLEAHPTLRFHDDMSSIGRSLKNHSTGFQLVLLIDEFTDVYKSIQNQRIPREFMKAWKAIVEKKYFASVLVGQDIMPAFKQEFPNEFGVTEDIRVTYLDEAAAKKLVQGPIGNDRFAGGAVQRLLGLTANSPYYTMMFCARLVDYMNVTRSLVVTEADIHVVKEEMLRGDRRLTRDKFDNLLTAGDGVRDSGIDPAQTYAICKKIASADRSTGGWCGHESVYGELDTPVVDALLSDLETRDVVERKGQSYRLRVGLFRDWLLLQG